MNQKFIEAAGRRITGSSASARLSFSPIIGGKPRGMTQQRIIARPVNWLWISWLTIFVALLFGRALAAAAAANYTVVEVPTGQRFVAGGMAPSDGRTQEQRGVVWLDNSRIMFRGYTPGPTVEQRKQGIYIWDVEKNDVTQYGDEEYFCYADGWIYLWVPSKRSVDEPSTYRYGQFGKEKPGLCEKKVGEDHNCIRDVNMSCKAAQSRWAEPLGPESRIEVQLRSDDGVIVARSAKARLVRKNFSYEEIVQLSRQPVLLINKQHPKGKPLPIQEIEEIGTRKAAYSEFAKKYVFIAGDPKDNKPGKHSIWPEGKAQPVYLMGRDGEIEVVEILPKIKDWTGIFQALPTKVGLAIWGEYGRIGGGIFLYDGIEIEAIDRGHLSTFAVSPDGCKLAFGIIDDYGKSRVLEYRVKYVNLCEKGR